jgi:hypothetical protein
MVGTSTRERRKSRWATLALAALVAASTGLCLRWVFLVPIYQSPDEPAHLDYALALRQNGGLFRPEGPPRLPLETVHPVTQYLADRTATAAVAFHGDVRMPPGYGTPAFYAALDRERPPLDDAPLPPPGLAWVYPYGYYALLAGWLAVWERLDGSLTSLFFGARLFSVALLAATLLFSYGAARELGHRRRFCLLVTAAMGFLPLTLFVASYVQPDNLSFALVSACFYLSLRVGRRPDHAGLVAALGWALGGLLVTKQHYYLCTVLPASAHAVGAWLRAGIRPGRRTALALALAGPSLALGAVHWWSVRDAVSYYGPATPPAPLALLNGLRRALTDFSTGATHRSFWGVYGWMDTPLVIHNAATTAAVRLLVRVVTWSLAVLTLMRLRQALGTLARLWRRGNHGAAVRLLVSNVPVNSFILFTGLMFVLFAVWANRFGAQGRNWLPLLLPMLLVALRYAPSALRRPSHRAVLACGAFAGLFAYELAGNVYALMTIRDRYYDPSNSRPMCECRAAEWRPDRRAPAGERVFAVDGPRFVFAVRIRYRLAAPAGTPVQFTWYWSDGAPGEGQAGRVEQALCWTPRPEEKTLYVWVNAVVNCWRVRLDGAPDGWEVCDAVAYVPPPAPDPR